VDDISVTVSTWKTHLVLGARMPDTSASRSWLGDLLRNEVATTERLASRFRPDSEVSRINRAAGTWVDTGWDFVAILTASLEAAGATDGLVDPLLAEHVVAAGYDVWADQDSGIRGTPNASRWMSIEIRPGGSGAQVRIPPGSALDLGAVTKGWLADRLTQIVHSSIGADCLANMGGDLRVLSPGQPWVVAAQADDGRETSMELTDAGLATSGVGHRSWSGGHHLIDPRTGLPAATSWTSVSVLAGTAAGANSASTAAAVLGDAGPAWLAGMGLDGWFVSAHDERCVGRWAHLRRANAACE